jgi:hypothetical protein
VRLTLVERAVQPQSRGGAIDELREGREFVCPWCGEPAWICHACDHGQRYCSSRCSSASRADAIRRAGAAYQQTDVGRANHAKRQQRYLERKERRVAAAADSCAKMTQQGSGASSAALAISSGLLVGCSSAEGAKVEATSTFAMHPDDVRADEGHEHEEESAREQLAVDGNSSSRTLEAGEPVVVRASGTRCCVCGRAGGPPSSESSGGGGGRRPDAAAAGATSRAVQRGVGWVLGPAVVKGG